MLELLNFGYMTVCDVLRDLIPFVQFKKRENTHGGALLLVKLHAEVCNFTKSNTPPWVFFKFLNCKNGTKSRKASVSLFFTLGRF